jgi:hypothetical protein
MTEVGNMRFILGPNILVANRELDILRINCNKFRSIICDSAKYVDQLE